MGQVQDLALLKHERLMQGTADVATNLPEQIFLGVNIVEAGVSLYGNSRWVCERDK